MNSEGYELLLTTYQEIANSYRILCEIAQDSAEQMAKQLKAETARADAAESRLERVRVWADSQTQQRDQFPCRII